MATFLSVVIHRGLLVPCGSLDLAALVPECALGPGPGLESLLDVLAVIFLSSHLAPELRGRWRLLFASRLHGQSFSQLCGRITHRGPCLALLEDRDGHVFGGFASRSWEVKPQFQGEPEAGGSLCLFLSCGKAWSRLWVVWAPQSSSVALAVG